MIPRIQEVAEKYHLPVIDLHAQFAGDSSLLQADGIHPNEKGVKKMADIIAEVLKNTK